MKKRLILALLLPLLMAACSPSINTRGNLISDNKFREVQPVMSSRADVEQKWGPPTTVSTLDPNTWYYIGETTEQEGVFAPKVTKRRIICVKFDAKDMIVSIDDVDPKLAKDIKPSERTTPTAGKEYTMFQQFVGNIGKFNSDQKAKQGQ